MNWIAIFDHFTQFLTPLFVLFLFHLKTQTTVPRRLNASDASSGTHVKLKGFKIPDRAKAQLALQDRTNSPPESAAASGNASAKLN